LPKTSNQNSKPYAQKLLYQLYAGLASIRKALPM